MTTSLRIERVGPLARVWLDRPEVRSALDGALVGALAAAFAGLAGEPGVRAIRASAEGREGVRAFSRNPSRPGSMPQERHDP